MDFLNTLYVGEYKKEAALGYCSIYEPVEDYQGLMGLHGFAALMLDTIMQGVDYVGQITLTEFEQRCGKMPHAGAYNFSAENSTSGVKIDCAAQINRERYAEIIFMQNGLSGVKIYTVKPLDSYVSTGIKELTEGQFDAIPVIINEDEGSVMYGLGLLAMLESM